MNMEKHPPLLTYSQACDLISNLPVRSQTENVSIDDCAGRVLADYITLPKDQPSFDRCTMDGFAIKPIADQRIFDIVGIVHAGEEFTGSFNSGQAIRIMTGAPTPADCCVVPIELCYHDENQVTVQEHAPLDLGKNIAQRGEDGHAGDVIAEAGCRLSTAVISSCAMAGAREVTVFRNPKIAIITTGDEVGGEGSASICDSNGPLLKAMCTALGCESTRYHARDTEEDLRACIETAAAECDIIVSTGGVSAGNKDFVPATAQELGFKKIFHKVAIQPGKPILVCQHHDGRFFVGLPGNPVSVLATAHLFLCQVIGSYWGGWVPEWIELPLVNAVSSKKRHLFLPASLERGGLNPVLWNGSGDLLAAASGDGLLNIPADSNLCAGDMVQFLPYIGAAIGDHGILPLRKK